MKTAILTTTILLLAATAQAARPGAFHSDLLLLYVGFGLLLLLFIGVDYGWKRWKGK